MMAFLNIGFIGTGLMGRPMATHLANAGHTLTLFDIDEKASTKAAASIGDNASAVKSPRAVAEVSDIISTMLPDGKIVQKVVMGKDGILESINYGAWPITP